MHKVQSFRCWLLRCDLSQSHCSHIMFTSCCCFAFTWFYLHWDQCLHLWSARLTVVHGRREIEPNGINSIAPDLDLNCLSLWPPRFTDLSRFEPICLCFFLTARLSSPQGIQDIHCSVHSLRITTWLRGFVDRLPPGWMLILNCQHFRSRTKRLSRNILWRTIRPFRSACLSIFLLKSKTATWLQGFHSKDRKGASLAELRSSKLTPAVNTFCCRCWI